MSFSSTPSRYKYAVKGVFKAHTSDVRVVTNARVPDGGFLTGSRDMLVKLWTPTENGYRDEHTFMGATKFIASLCALPVSTQFPEGLILAGSNDCAIYGFTPKSQHPVMKLLGHSNVVCTLSAGFGLFVSGSWDGTARVWSGQQCTAVLEGHNSTVWATEVYPLQNIILTGSADHTIRIWRDGQCEKVLYGHEDCVRGLVIVRDKNMNILSCSNDATVRLWNIQGECLNIFQSHENYIYSITLLKNGIDFATCSEDEYVKIWQNSVCVQSIKIPSNTLWNITCLQNEDLVVGCSDGSVCVLGNTGTGCIFESGDSNMIDSSNLYIRAFQWDDAKQRWIMSPCDFDNKVLSSSTDGLELDINEKPQNNKDLEFYFDVDKQLCKLDYNRNEDPYRAVLNLMAEHNLNPSHFTDIFNFLIKNWIGFPKVCHLATKLPPIPNDFYPLDKYYSYSNANVSGLKKKLLEFTHLVPKTQHISEESIEKLIQVLDFPDEVSQEQMIALETTLTWNDEFLFPALDFLRLAVKCKPIGAKVGNQSFINHSLKVLRTSEKSVNLVLVIKVLCNLFDFPEGEELMAMYQLKVCDTVMETLSSKVTHKAIASLYLNYAVAAYKGLKLDIDAFCSTLIEMLRNVVDSDSLYKIFIAIGTLSVAEYAAFANFHSLHISKFLIECKKHINSDNATIVLENLIKNFQM